MFNTFRFILISISLSFYVLAFLNLNTRNSVALSNNFKYSISMSSAPIDDRTRSRIEKLVNENKVLLFMKGNKLFPQCGFSNTACRILDAIGAPYETVNVLEDNEIRNGIKVFSNWPTIPQLYVNKEFIGGSDIMVELYQSGELAEMIEVLKAS